MSKKAEVPQLGDSPRSRDSPPFQPGYNPREACAGVELEAGMSLLPGSGLRFSVVGRWVWGLGCGFWCLDLGFVISGLWFWVEGLGLRPGFPI